MLPRNASPLAVVILVFTPGCMDWFERVVFFPDPVMVGTPAAVGLSYENAKFTASDGVRLHGWYIPGTRPETLLWFHGNAGNISHRLENLSLLHRYVGANVLLFDYRQYGRSEGKASEQGLYLDARGALEYLRSRPDVAPEQIVYFGRSLGSAVAIDLATAAPPRAMILETPFVSAREMARTIAPWPLVYVVPAASFDNLSKLSTVGTPLLFIHGTRDEIVPYVQGRSLFEAAPSPKAFYTIPDAHHNDTYLIGGEAYFRRIQEFLDELP